jgi:hypothetical protein
VVGRAAPDDEPVLDAVLAGELVGDAQGGVDAAVERAVDVGDEPVDGLTSNGSAFAACSASTAFWSIGSARQLSASIRDSASSFFCRKTLNGRPSGPLMRSPGVGSCGPRSRGMRLPSERFGEKYGSPPNSHGL